MHTSSGSTQVSGTRRQLLGWSFAGVITSIAGYFGWRHAQETMRAEAARKNAEAAGPPQGEKLPRASAPAAMSREAFVPHLESEFRIESVANLKLIDVSAAQTLNGKTAKFTAFSLLFTAPKKFEAESKVYRLTHAQLGEMDLFLSPVGDGKKRVLLEACFTQRV